MVCHPPVVLECRVGAETVAGRVVAGVASVCPDRVATVTGMVVAAVSACLAKVVTVIGRVVVEALESPAGIAVVTAEVVACQAETVEKPWKVAVP